MSHKTMVGGTVYDVQSGKTLVGGTLYTVQSGRVMTAGTLWNVPFGRMKLCLGQDNPCGADVTLEDNGQIILGISGVPKDQTAEGWLELTKNGAPYRLQPGDLVEFSGRFSGNGSFGVTCFTDPELQTGTAVAQYSKETVTFTVTQPCYVRVWARLTGGGLPYENIRLAVLSFAVNGEAVPVEI